MCIRDRTDSVHVQIIRYQSGVLFCQQKYKMKTAVFYLILHISKDLFNQLVHAEQLRIQLNIAAAGLGQRKQAFDHHLQLFRFIPVSYTHLSSQRLSQYSQRFANLQPGLTLIGLLTSPRIN